MQEMWEVQKVAVWDVQKVAVWEVREVAEEVKLWKTNPHRTTMGTAREEAGKTGWVEAEHTRCLAWRVWRKGGVWKKRLLLLLTLLKSSVLWWVEKEDEKNERDEMDEENVKDEENEED